jgi:selenocysteine lyase/cysteine desulfurase
MDPAALRAAFPVCGSTAYLNAGTCGPLAQAALVRARQAWEQAGAEGRSKGCYERYFAITPLLRAAYARLLAADPGSVALTTSTTEGIVRVLGGLDLQPGDEVLTAPDEHPGLLGPLITLRERRGVTIRTAPLADLARAVEPQTALVACSHVSWTTGAFAPAELAALEIPVLLDGAQGIGAVPVDVEALGCAFYAGSGQKWLCGPVGTGMLWIAPRWSGRVAPQGLAYANLADANAGLLARPWPDARRHDAATIAVEQLEIALAAHDVLDAFGWPAVHEHAAALAERLAGELRERGRTVAPRGPSTLVSWESADPAGEVERLAAAGVVVRSLPGTWYLRASVGAWNDAGDLERLLGALA